jgi:glycosyltransferase involved in cell wall biosynthesis
VNDKTLSLILPIHNGSVDLPIIVQECLAVVPRFFADYEIILLDDGNRDPTPTIVDDLVATHDPVMVIRHTRPHGYARALVSGWSAARGDYVLVLDPSSPISISELSRFMPYIGRFDIINGYCLQSLSISDRLHTRLVNTFFGLDLHDSHCHFSLFRSDLLHDLNLDTSRPSSLIELYFRASRHNVTVVEVGLSANRRIGTLQPSRVHRSFRELGRLWLQLRRPAAVDDIPTPAPFWPRKAFLGAGLAVAIWGFWFFWRRQPISIQSPDVHS